MKLKHVEVILNKALKEHKNLLYGNSSNIVVERIDWVLSKNSHIINLKIYTDEIELAFESHPDGINFLIDKCWTVLGRKTKVIVVSSIDVIV